MTRQREIEYSVQAQQYLLRLGSTVRMALLDALERLANDPYLLDLQEEEGVSFIVVAEHVLFVDVSDEAVAVRYVKKHMSS